MWDERYNSSEIETDWSYEHTAARRQKYLSRVPANLSPPLNNQSS